MHGRKKSDLPQTAEAKAQLAAKTANYNKVLHACLKERRAKHNQRLQQEQGQREEEEGKTELGVEGGTDPSVVGAVANGAPEEAAAESSSGKGGLQEEDADAEQQQRQQRQEQQMGLLGKVLRINPDVYTLWNLRREILCEQPHAAETLDTELGLTVDAIKRNPKSYPSWYHRRWMLERTASLCESGKMENHASVFKAELGLCESFLQMDGRNFHCWSYRQWVVEQLPLSAEDDFAFLTAKIEQNFSNYSAFHYRSKLLPRLVSPHGRRDKWGLLREELDMCHQAMYTEPSDQSVWWYHNFLVRWPGADEGASERYLELLEGEAATIRELLEVEEDCKWAMVTLLSLLQLRQTVAQGGGRKAAAPPPAAAAGVGGGEEQQGRQEQSQPEGESAANREVERLREGLMSVDPMHINYYKALT